MVIFCKEILTDYKETYEKVSKLVNKQLYSPTEPYRSQYDAARDALLQTKQMLKSSLASMLAEEMENGRDALAYKIILAFVCRDLGRIHRFNKESSAAEEQLQECIELMEEHRMLPEAIIPYMGSLTELGIVYADCDHHHKAHETLMRAEHVYEEFKQAAAGDAAMAIMDIFGTADEVEQGKEGAAELESLYTQCAFYLTQVLGHLGQLEKSVEYFHLTLRRQLPLNIMTHIGFALSTATLSLNFIERNMFKEARHHLAIAQHIMTQYEAKMLTPELSEQQRADIKQRYKLCYADVARYWGKYGLMLLKASGDRLCKNDDEKLAADAKFMCLDPHAYRFPNMDVSAIEERVSADYCLTFDDAKRVYHFVIKWLDRAKEYYKPETETTEYANIIKDFAALYKNVAFFEKDPVNRAKMHKRRAKYYEDLLELFNPAFHMAICRECWLGCGLALSDILDIKLAALKTDRSPTVQEAQKINQVCEKAIKNFLEFVNSYMEKDGLRLKSALPVEEQRSVLYAYFRLGSLHIQMISADCTVQLKNMNNSLKYFKLFTDECANHLEVAASLQPEFINCPEFANFVFFEKDSVSQAKMHERRTKYYEDLLELLNPVFHMAICRQCWLGCGLAHSDILNIKLAALKTDRSPTVQEAQKINQVCEKAIKNFLEFVNSCMEKDGLRLKSALSVKEQGCILYAYFLLGCLHIQMISADCTEQLKNMNYSLKYFKLFTNECANRLEVAASLQPEVRNCPEFANFAFFEKDSVSQAKMYERRTKYYEDLLELLNPVFHMAICRQCWLGCGLALSNILDIKLAALKTNRSPTLQEAQKINQVCEKAIKNFLEYVKSFIEKNGFRLKSALPFEEQRSVLYAYFRLGCLHKQIISTDCTEQLENMNNSLKYFKLFTNECAKSKEAAASLKPEFGNCPEFANFAFFEKDSVSQAKMHERRTKYYEDLLELLNPVFHMAICRQCWLGCGLALSDILDIKLAALKTDRRPTVEEAHKINQVCENAIKNFLEYVKSFIEKNGLRLKTALPVDEQRSVLYAYFRLGCLHNQMISADCTVQLENMNNSLKYFKLFTNECAKSKESAAILQAQLGNRPRIVNLAFFEKDPASRAKIHMRHAKYYEDLLGLLNPVFHLTICRQCWLGCGLAHYSILEIKLNSLKTDRSPTVEEAQKINQVCQEAIKNFLEYVKSFMEKDGLRLKSALSFKEQGCVLYAYFLLGSLHFKMITADCTVQLENMNNSLKYFKLFTNECAKHKEAAAILQAKLGDSLLMVFVPLFEEDAVNRAKMHKCHVKYYEDLLKLLNPVFHMAICRECWLGCGMACLSIWEIKFNAAFVTDRPQKEKDQEMNEVCEKAIKNFLEFINSYMEKDGLRLKKDICLEEQRRVLGAYYLLGDLHYQLFSNDLSVRLENLKNSLKYFKLFTDGCAERIEAATSMQVKLANCREKFNVLPLEIACLQMRLGT